MTDIQRATPTPVVPLHDRAFHDLSLIRDSMERAASFSALPGWWMAGLGAALIARRHGG